MPAAERPSGQPGQAPAAPADERPMKPCPDCAEMVLEAARKCRYCGYRFDRPEPKRPAREGLFAHLMRRSAPRLTMTETLAQLGVELAPGEQPAGLWLGRVKGIDGYVALTDQRLCFVIGLRHQTATPAKPRQHSLDDLAAAEVDTSRRKPALVLTWRDAPDMRIDGLAAHDLGRLHEALLGQVPR